jgi:hypothetical protein
VNNHVNPTSFRGYLDIVAFALVIALVPQITGTDKKSNHTSQSNKLISRLNLTAFASIRNAVCAINGA